MIASQGALDRAAELRPESGVIERLIAEPDTRVVVVRDGRLRVTADTADDVSVLRVDSGSVGEAEWALLGRDSDGAALLLASVSAHADSIDAAPDETWLGLRDAGGRLSALESEIFVSAIALAGWLVEARHCPSCGTALELTQAGWARHCPGCGREHFPRTDPAVIVAVESPDGEKLLLGANANWRGRMYSCFAGFVEAGESLESAVHREIEEEAGVRLADVRYLGSQPWPYPRSLMIGFRAVADDERAVPDGEEIIDVRWLTRDEIGSALAGDGPVGLPGEASIARRLIVDWHADRGSRAL
ncbi:NAD(+) diphosphatase [Microbacterium sp. H1-D42]|uniref:NAD(+) diphosphatase n=1 Tax=Microbacterium sp. H1-D42 TaxID=2925844 RepID=UPI001F53B92C|nr:NAD(+) diphosphatase [Microbacterium sp. H1-D42]UNK69756.1 NAD(+) diphosphatase [Microbacterium sp. H1-D42]